MTQTNNKVKESLNLTAMIDMMTILLVFLLVQYASMSFSDVDASAKNLPFVENAGEIKSDTQLILTESGLKDIKGNTVDFKELKGPQVALQVDKSLKMEAVQKVKQQLNEVGITHIEMGVIETH